MKYFKIGIPDAYLKELRKWLEFIENIPKDTPDVEVVDRILELYVYGRTTVKTEEIPSTEECNCCPKCGSTDRELIDKCVIYDKYYICKNKKCGFCDFSKSKHLTKEENDARLKEIKITTGS